MRKIRRLTYKTAKVFAQYGKQSVVWFRKRTPMQKGAIIASVLVFVFLVLPNFKAGLKVFGFLEKDFIVSTSGALFETNPKMFPYFRALIGNAADEALQTLRIEHTRGTFTLGFLSADKEVIPQKTEVQTDENTENVSEEAISRIEDIEEEVAAIHSELEKLSENVADITATVAASVTGSSQNYFGPYERLSIKRVEGSVSYYQDRGALVEEIIVSSKDTHALTFLFESENLTPRILSDQTIEILTGETPVMRISQLLSDSKQTKFPLPSVQSEIMHTTNGKTILVLKLPAEIADAAAPFILVRRFELVNQKEVTAQNLLTIAVGPQLSQNALVTAPKPRFLSFFGENMLFWDGLTQMLFYEIDGVIEPLFSQEGVTGLDCNDRVCILATATELQSFNPDTTRAKEFDARKGEIEKLSVTDGPIGGIAIAGNTLIRTTNYNPEGSVYQSASLLSQGTKIKEKLSFPTLPALSQNGEWNAFFADGKVYLGMGGTYTDFFLPDPPIDIALGPENALYFIVPYPQSSAAILARVRKGVGLEVARSIVGDLQSLTIHNTTLSFSVSLNAEAGGIVQTEIDALDWIPVSNFSL